MDIDEQACDYCGQLIIVNGHRSSTDMLICTTTYTDTEVNKTMEQEPDGISQDYIVICPDCTKVAVRAWNKMVRSIKSTSAGGET